MSLKNIAEKPEILGTHIFLKSVIQPKPFKVFLEIFFGILLINITVQY
jgi:hypothetical protein